MYIHIIHICTDKALVSTSLLTVAHAGRPN